MTSYARDVLEELFSHLQQYDIATISGMAEGVDQLAHELSMTHHIPTIAVLGGGIGTVSKSVRRSVMDSVTDA
ncbi:MAG: DNA-processing protein DprA [Candidatus Peribacteria bacterium]|nr:MAG: DNA-processing protein DprA [Candidatus Peribacteria bacterium]